MDFRFTGVLTQSHLMQLNVFEFRSNATKNFRFTWQGLESQNGRVRFNQPADQRKLTPVCPNIKDGITIKSGKNRTMFNGRNHAHRERTPAVRMRQGEKRFSNLQSGHGTHTSLCFMNALPGRVPSPSNYAKLWNASLV